MSNQKTKVILQPKSYVMASYLAVMMQQDQ